MAVLITGGAGYIGSHVAWLLADQGERIVVLDNLSTGVRALVPPTALFVNGDAGDQPLVARIIAEQAIDAILHFAGSISVPESMSDPLGYYRNNTSQSRSLIEAAVAGNVRHFVFSSTAAVYGVAGTARIAETAPLRPINPYGRSKLMTELMLQDAAAAHDLRFVALRYFNVAGADPGGRSGQASPAATHLIKVATEAATGKRAGVDVFGTDYDTPDGTGIRDYIHVTDLAAAHALALAHLRAGGDSLAANCGYGKGRSVLEVLNAVQRIAGVTLNIRNKPRRTGDPPMLVARADLIRERLGWRPVHDDLDVIVRTAWDWQRKLSAQSGTNVASEGGPFK